MSRSDQLYYAAAAFLVAGLALVGLPYVAGGAAFGTAIVSAVGWYSSIGDE